jgi:hypothetical protein
MVGTLLYIGVPLLILGLMALAEQAYYDGLERKKERVMAAYARQEAAQAHRRRLEAIDIAVYTTEQELTRIAAEAGGEIIEGTAVEVRRP